MGKNHNKNDKSRYNPERPKIEEMDYSTAVERLAILDERLGKNVGATRERARLQAVLDSALTSSGSQH